MPPSKSNEKPEETELLIGLGSNVGEKQAHLTAAVARLVEHCRILAVSSLYRTSPVGYRDQAWFLNAALKLRTVLTPADLLDLVKTIERDHGRTYVQTDGPRTLDIDLLAAENDRGPVVSSDRRPLLPHPRLHRRRFVLEPLVEIAPEWRHPGLGRTARELLADLDSDETVERLNAPGWPPRPGA